MRRNKKLTITAGTPLNVFTGTIAAGPNPVYVRSVSIQMATGGSGLGYVMDGIYGGGRVPATTNEADVTMELFPATDTTPGGIYSDSAPVRDYGLDVNAMWIDGAHTGDTVRVSYDQIL